MSMSISEVANRLSQLRNDEDNALWTQGDVLRDNPLSKADLRKVADILQRKVSTLELRRRVSVETPTDQRKPQYSWSIYSIFIKIEDPAMRWQLMFSRPEWTIPEANETVRGILYGVGPRKPKEAITKTMVVNDIMVKGTLEKGVLTVKVWLGDSYDVEVDQSGRTTTLTFRE